MSPDDKQSLMDRIDGVVAGALSHPETAKESQAFIWGMLAVFELTLSSKDYDLQQYAISAIDTIGRAKQSREK